MSPVGLLHHFESKEQLLHAVLDARDADDLAAADFEMDGWTWQDLTPRTVAGGRGWYTGTIHAADGTRIASVAQEQLFSRH